MNDIRFPAEWEGCESVLMAWPDLCTDWSDVLDMVLPEYVEIIRAFTGAGLRVVLLAHSRKEVELYFSVLPERLHIIECEYNDTWTRDYGPLTVERNGRLRALDFGFNAWGLKFASDRDNLVNLGLRNRHFIEPAIYRNERDFILEGGSVESDGRGTILTTTKCLCSANRNGGKSKEELNEILAQRLGADHVLWLDHGALIGDDTDSHIDTLARLCPHNTIAFTGCRDMDDPQFEELLKMRAQLTLFRTAEGEPYNLLELPMPAPVFDSEGNRLPATYANYLVTSTHLVMPVYGDKQKDTLACQTIRVAYPEHEVVPVPCRSLLLQHGSLHCATMQIPENIFNPTVYEY